MSAFDVRRYRDLLAAFPSGPYVFPNRWPEQEVLEPEQHPEPEQVARPASDTEVAGSARSFRTLLERHGWRTNSVYARGTVPGKSQRVVDLVAVRGIRECPPTIGGFDNVVATWEDGKSACAYWNREKMTVTELKKKVADG